MKQQLESTPREQRESFFGICIIALILLLKISRAKSNGLHSDLKPCQGRQHFQGREKRKQRRGSRRNFYSRTSIITPMSPLSRCSFWVPYGPPTCLHSSRQLLCPSLELGMIHTSELYLIPFLICA